MAVYNTAGRRHLEHCVLPSMQSSLAPFPTYVCAADSQNALRSPLGIRHDDDPLVTPIGKLKEQRNDIESNVLMFVLKVTYYSTR